jgi:outer membrane protein OmpA-like peptidoglycan-associated protein
MNKIKKLNFRLLKASLLGMLAFSSIGPLVGQTVFPLDKVNTPYDEQHPVLSPEGILYFTVAFHPENHNGTADLGDIWSSPSTGSGNFQVPAKVPELCTAGYDVVVGFLNENTVLIYHDGRGKKQGIHQYSTIGESWQYEGQLDLGSFRNQSSHFSGRLAPSGDMLVLSLASFGTYGNEDIYVSFLRGPGQWSTPQNLGPDINTFQQEMTPSISKDKQVLFFSSNGHGSTQGTDIFYSERLDESWESWSVPKPLSTGNTIGVELAYFELTDDSEKAIYTTTQNSEGYGDILMVQSERITRQETPIKVEQLAKSDTQEVIPKDLEEPEKNDPAPELQKGEAVLLPSPKTAPKEITSVALSKEEEKVEVAPKNEETAHFPGTLKVLDINTLSEIAYTVALVDTSGVRSANLNSDLIQNLLPIDTSLIREMVVTSAGYLPLAVKGAALSNLTQPLLMTPASKGVSIVLEDVLFKRGTADLLDEKDNGFIVHLADFLKENKSIKILLEGHTDNLGNVQLNKELSLDRASAIRKRLVDLGVEFERMRIAGWGGTKPIASNQNEGGRASNRRVEMVIVDQ